MKDYVLSLDQGTTSTRACVFDRAGKLLYKSQREIKQYYPSSGWVEHDLEEIFSSAVFVIKDVLEKNGLTAADIAAMGITNQRETVVVWEKATGKPVYNAVVWQCRRTALFMEKLKNSEKEAIIYSKTGLMCDAYFSASKIKWILDFVPDARERARKGELLAGTVDSFLLYRLSGLKVHSTDYTNASRTMLYNIHTMEWDKELLSLFDVPEIMLPEVKPSGYDYGVTEKTLFGEEIPVCALAGDQQSALFGQKCWNKGDIKNTYGTGCFLLMNTGSVAVESTRGLVTSLAAGLTDKPDYVLEGSVFVGGAVVQWLRDEMKLISSAAESEKLARAVDDCGGVYFVPAFVGLGAPHWDQTARGLITGITRGTRREHIVRAALEAIAYQVFDVLHAMERDLKEDVTALNVDGGASANDFLMQFQADILFADVRRPEIIETTALGAAYLAGLACGFFASEKEIKNTSNLNVFRPSVPEAKRREMLLGWEEAVARTKAR